MRHTSHDVDEIFERKALSKVGVLFENDPDAVSRKYLSDQSELSAEQQEGLEIHDVALLMNLVKGVQLVAFCISNGILSRAYALA